MHKLKLHSFLFLLVIIVFAVQSCDYLNVVPRNNPSYEQVFSSRKGAEKALHGLYSYLPVYNAQRRLAYATDEISWPPGYSTGSFRAKIFLTNNFSASSASYNFWTIGGYRPRNLYQGIRYCSNFIKHIKGVPDVTKQEKLRWKGQAYFLIAYYHFLLMKVYGPIVLIDKVQSFNASKKKIFHKRSSIDSTVAFITKYFDKAIPLLPQSYDSRSLGKVTSVAAKGMKAKVLVFAASPLYNGGAPEMYEDLKGPEGKYLFPQSPDPSKWNKALDALKVAIDAAHAAGKKLYYYTGGKPRAWDTWTKKDQAVATNLFKIVKPWNDELIWGYSAHSGSTHGYLQYNSYRTSLSPVRGLNSFEVTIEAASRFYSKDGLPISVDPDYDYKDRYKVKSGDSTAYFNRDRGPRYYATVAFDRGKYYMNGKTLIVHSRKGEMQGLTHHINDGGSTGMFQQKFVNPKTILKQNNVQIQRYPFPIMRLADLYLLYAEAYNEIHGNLSGDALTYFNDVRKRAGIPSLQDSWSKVGEVPTTKKKLRQIIHRERYNELALEGHWFYDIRRWVVAAKYLDRPIHGWTVTASKQNEFYQPQSSYENLDRKFDPRFYFLGVPQRVININPKLVQNPGY